MYRNGAKIESLFYIGEGELSFGLLRIAGSLSGVNDGAGLKEHDVAGMFMLTMESV